MSSSMLSLPSVVACGGRPCASQAKTVPAARLVARASMLSARHSAIFSRPQPLSISQASAPASRGASLVVRAGGKKMVKKLEKEIQTLQSQILGTMSAIEAELEARATSLPTSTTAVPDDYHQVKAERDALLNTVEVLTDLLKGTVGAAAPVAAAPAPPVSAPPHVDSGVVAEAAHGVIASLQAGAEEAISAAQAKADESTDNARALAAEVIKLRKELGKENPSSSSPSSPSPAAAPPPDTYVPPGDSPLAGVLGTNYVGSSAASSVAAAVASLSPRTPAPAAAEAPAAPAVTQERGEGAVPAPSDEGGVGPRPVPLQAGDDDVYWVGRLHAAMYVEGFFCGEEETEDIIFGPGTEDALRTYQACTDGLEETGFVNAATWDKLLGPAPGAAEAAAPAAAAQGVGEGEEGEVPTDEAAMGPRPALMTGSDDIYWVGRLHNALYDAGYFCGEGDTEDIVFGSRTEDALRTYQVCTGLEESGFTDDATWEALLGPAPSPVEKVEEEAAPAPAPAAPEEVAATNGQAAVINGDGGGAQARVDDAGKVVRPVLADGDGGRFVHELQTALNDQGYFCGDEDCQWWQFGYSTEQALKTFQSCMGLPETGTTYQDVWRALLGDKADEMPDSDEEDSSEYQMDLTKGRGVYLIGEDRWEDPTRLGEGGEN